MIKMLVFTGLRAGETPMLTVRCIEHGQHGPVAASTLSGLFPKLGEVGDVIDCPLPPIQTMDGIPELPVIGPVDVSHIRGPSTLVADWSTGEITIRLGGELPEA